MLRLFLLLTLSIFLNSAFCQSGCTNPTACNFNELAVIDDGSCLVPILYVINGTLTYDCSFSTAGDPLDQNCGVNVAAFDPFCIEAQWDGVCQNLYETCCGGNGSWYIPGSDFDDVDYTPMVFACDQPEGYEAFSGSLGDAFASNFSNCVYNNWSPPCQSQYNLLIYGCQQPISSLPLSLSGSQLSNFGCNIPEGYVPAITECVEEVLENDEVCSLLGWDMICQEAYNFCAYGCYDAQWYIPIPGYVTGLPLMACETPEGYAPATPECIAYVLQVQASCVYDVWNDFCSFAYDDCISGGCGGQSYALPVAPFGNGIAPEPTCGSVETGWYDVDASLAFTVFNIEPNCYFGWDESCWEVLDDITGCSFGWYVPNVLLFSTPYFGCDAEDFYIPISNQCAAELLSIDANCFLSAWSLECDAYAQECIGGCTYPTACNYSADALRDDQSCIFPGCLDVEAVNYDSSAGCDDGSCSYPPGPTCDGDLDGNGSVNVTDLTLFLAAFGSECTP